MARIFRTETLELDGNLRLASASPGEFLIQSATGSTLMSRATIDSDISSLAAKNVSKDGDISTAEDQDDAVKSSVGTLDTKDTSLDGNISTAESQDNAAKSSIGTLDTKDTALDGDISTAEDQDDAVKSAISAANAADIVMDSDISSLAANISSNDIVAKSESVATSDESKVVTFGRTFGSTPAVLASLKSETANAPVIPAMVTAVSTTQCTVSFGDGIPDGVITYIFCRKYEFFRGFFDYAFKSFFWIKN